MRLSSILSTSTRNNPAKVKDPGIIRLVKAGYAVYDNSSGEIIFTPMGVKLAEEVFDRMMGSFREQGVQEISGRCSQKVALELMVRVLKREGQLPLIFMERQARSISITGFAVSMDESLSLMEHYIQLCRETVLTSGLRAYSLEEVTSQGLRIKMVVEGEKRSLGSREGLVCPSCGWRGGPSSPVRMKLMSEGTETELEHIYTPGATTISELCSQLDTHPSQTLKTMFYTIGDPDNGQLIAALARGDVNISLEKLSFCLGGVSVRRAEEAELRDVVGDVAGFCGPIGLPGEVRVIADKGVEGATGLVVGANRVDYHYRGACWGRDFSSRMVCDIASAGIETPCPVCGHSLEKGYLVEIASFSPAFITPEQYPSLCYVNEDRQKCRPHVWGARVDLEGVLVAIAGCSEEDLLMRCAPFDIHLISDIPVEDTHFPKVEEIYRRLSSGRMRILFDDRSSKLKSRIEDSSEMGIPVKFLVQKGSADKLQFEIWRGVRDGTLKGEAELEEYLNSLN
jgi:prolyl-tRNA synthetase